MLFYLTTLNLVHVLKKECPKAPEHPTNETFNIIEAWKHSDFLCRNYTLNGLVDSLYNVYSSFITTRGLWEVLEKKYKTEDAGTKKFIVAKFLDFKIIDSITVINQVEELQKFLDFKMIDSITVINQVEELQILINKIHVKGMMFNEAFQVASIIEKLSPSWKDFKNYLKHKRKELLMEDLIVRLRIEEDNRKNDKFVGKSFMEAKAHIVERECSNKRKLPFNNRKMKKPANNKPGNKKIKGVC
ncbi:hypothetical protein VitviT2T_009875 [Vitis vinifera]|uniref:Retrovirus-related Pol polyprotein from transposon TNT 1-94 n=1 Tax=Vitis vinifera TaxID=29760 RepID=A0ABY9C653_VITVI|nr:uncharacterized protein LOC109122879 [Vitis vinifera]WJZ90750.1 hypothetical protein VitviT2T_009875 [Vitis vinifera]